MRLHVATFGCQMSAADSEEWTKPLRDRGFTEVADPKTADAIVLNTCTVRQHAEDKALSFIGRLREWKDEDPERLLIVAGCAAERLGGWIKKRFPYVDLVVGAKSIEDYPKIVESALGARFDALSETRQAFQSAADRAISRGSAASTHRWDAADRARKCDRWKAAVTIMRGCNYSCSYCIVPAVRGRESYRSVDEILAEIRGEAVAGAREITLLGQTVNSYHALDGGREVRFPELLRRIGAIDEVARLRFESPHPNFLDDALIRAMAETPAVCEQMHLPAQSGSDRVLRLMRRNYDAAALLDKAARLRAALPRVELSTDIIVGFPSEGAGDFERTLEFVAALRPSWSYTFKYSPRGATAAAEMADDVPGSVKEERLKRLNALCDKLTEEALSARIGKVVEVLDERGGFGRTRDGFKVSWKAAGGGTSGRLVKIRVIAASKRVLRGDIHER